MVGTGMEEADRGQLLAVITQLCDQDTLLKSLFEGLQREQIRHRAKTETLSTTGAAVLLRAVALASSIAAIYPIQDILACHPAWRPQNPADERINVPGTVTPTNWTYRMPVDLRTLAKDKGFATFIASILDREGTPGENL